MYYCGTNRREQCRESENFLEDCTVWICDDEPQQAGFLQRLTADWAKRRAFKLHITQYHSAEELLFAYDADKRVDILLLDIELPGISGMELARRVRQSDRQLQIVFVSGYSDYLADGYEVEALHYLLKPVSAQKLDAVLDRALERLDARGRSLLVESDEGLCRLPLSEIRWLEVMGNYVTIHAGRDYTLRKPLKDLEPLLNTDGETWYIQQTVRCHPPCHNLLFLGVLPVKFFKSIVYTKERKRYPWDFLPCRVSGGWRPIRLN